MGKSITGGPKPSRPTLKIEFTSATNLARFAVENSWNLGNTAFFCGRQESPLGISFPWIFWRGARLDRLEPDPIGTGSGTTYYLFIDVARKKQTPANPPVEAYDLRQVPEDVCFYLRGGNSVGGYRSNTVTVPKASIAAALGVQ